MIHYAQLFADHLDTKGVKYTTQDDRVIQIKYRLDNINSVTLYVYFEKEGRPLVEIKCWNIINFGDNQALALEVCNQMNETFNFAKFHANDKNSICAEVDMLVTEETAGEFCYKMLGSMLCIIDEAYPHFAKARWA